MYMSPLGTQEDTAAVKNNCHTLVISTTLFPYQQNITFCQSFSCNAAKGQILHCNVHCKTINGHSNGYDYI